MDNELQSSIQMHTSTHTRHTFSCTNIYAHRYCLLGRGFLFIRIRTVISNCIVDILGLYRLYTINIIPSKSKRTQSRSLIFSSSRCNLHNKQIGNKNLFSKTICIVPANLGILLLYSKWKARA